MYDAVVVGGGIVGSSIGYHLARAGVNTVLLDRNDEGRATTAGAGVISAATSSRTADDDWFEFATDAVGYYPELVSQLEREGHSDTSYGRLGTIAVAIETDELESYDETVARIDSRQSDLAPVDELDPAAAVDRFPPLAEPKRAFHHPGAARVNGDVFARALRDAGREHGLTTMTGDVTEVRIDGDQVTGVETASGSRFDAEHAVIAGGAWSSSFGEQLAVEIPVTPKRGQIVHLEHPNADTGTWPIVKAFRHHYIVPWPDGRLVVGATREAGVGFEPRITAGGIHEVLEEALRVAPGLADATVVDRRVGLRPVCTDGMPVLGAVPDIDGAFLATGHGATGLMIGPYSGKLVADRIADTGSVPDRFSVTRFEDSSETK
ncbi:NAD(P)/FAD-dependent oxidoreductase [Natrialba sp. SSL1]|uniref:NAD(P)/FAD-dependent oxidoreductase n=1 Tax=Natrialba sp. SSL1 TaxID=1869245 RepID=UPI0008F87FDE|nr:FAD-dependent oxidoreductase [Natrialba sp. SSL1]OIB55285.1 FAD-dependent oxidoreductase [Natrialba sp. SSL1]